MNGATALERHKDRADVKEKTRFMYDVNYPFSGTLQYPSCVDALALHPVVTWGRRVAIRPENPLESPVNFAIIPLYRVNDEQTLP